jgi:hypothetical protein
MFFSQTIRYQYRLIFKTPNLKQAAINHYGCSTLLGIQCKSQDDYQYQIDRTILLNDAFQISISDISTCFNVMNVALI